MRHLKTLLPYIRPYRRGLAAGLVLVAIADAFMIAGPYVMKIAIDALAEPGVTSTRILGYAALIVAVAVLGGAARYGMRELVNGISRRIECDLRDAFFAQLLELDAAFYSRTRTGDLISHATNDTLAVRQAVGPAVMYLVNTAVTFAFALSLMLWISPRLTVLGLIPMAFLPPVVLGFARVIHRRFERIQEHFATLSTMVQENLTGVRIVRAYVQEEAQLREFDALNTGYLARNMHLARASAMFHPILMLLAGLGMVVVLWRGGLAIVDGEITVGEFVAFGVYLALLIWPMIALGWVISLYQRGAASMARINRIMAMEPAVASPPEPVRLGSVRGGVEFRDVWFRYPGSERWVLKNISFQAEPGQTVAVVGGTGSGKSTLVSLIPRISDPTQGSVLVDEVPTVREDLAELRRAIGTVPQDPFLFSDTIGANIGLGLTAGAVPWDDGRAPDAVVRAAKIAQLDATIRAFPNGYRSLLGERGINLSGGQKQRATLARALAREPAILILDDALSAVDTETEREILAQLRDVRTGRTCFIISHRVSAVMNADLILVLEDGEIVERGTHAELLARGETYATLLRRQLLEQDLEAEVTN
ncbi:MAG: ABC transporter ATP-binding protein [Gemmatimonadetes bacterium]|nr:ABC transporter ATP-binding protein [Gemmatimonadota bacterium]